MSPTAVEKQLREVGMEDEAVIPNSASIGAEIKRRSGWRRIQG